MKSFIPTGLASALALFAATQTLPAEDAPAGALEKITAALPAKSFATPKKERKLLVFSKTNGFRHGSIATGKIALTEMGKKTGAFETVISDDLANFEADTLKNFDAVCFLSTTQNVFSPSPEEMKKLSEEEKKDADEKDIRLKANLMAFVKSGHGFIGIHAATDTFYEWPEYNQMINGLFDGHPWTADVKVSIKVEPGQEKHPLAAMFNGENVEFPEEIYQFKEPYNSKSVHMLLRLDTEKTDMTRAGIKRTDGDFGVAWARHWGKGRVFYCSIGHNHEMYWNPKILSHYLAGIQWALGDYDVEVKDSEKGD
ncbi:MAG: ThuA domain-containing protein [Luteolibacter sp.]|uniref:ThuA domain-containing protein n=1 Tax=Luteolibacter sp. TaxID=1962973 RepID=UPI0032660DBD